MSKITEGSKGEQLMYEALNSFGMSTLSHDKIAVVIPCYNEEQTVCGVVKGFRAALPEADIYVIDNNSSDGTVKEAIAAGAHVILEPRQGKGNVVRSIVRRIDADVYVMVDGDLTYPAEAVRSLLAPVLCGLADMVVGDRISNKSYEGGAVRRFHGFGNWLVCSLVNRLFQTNLHDIMSGYRVMTRAFLATLPILSDGFEIETEITLHAVDKRLKIVEVPIDYRDRPPGSYSKLRTYTDGMLVLKSIGSLFKNYKPLVFFGGLTLVIFTVGLVVGMRPILEYIDKQYVFAVPSAVLSAALMILSMLSACCGLILDTVVRHQQENYELMLTQNTIKARSRGGSGNSDSVVSGSLASPTPSGGGEPKERGNEEDETQSRSDLQGAGCLGGGQR